MRNGTIGTILGKTAAVLLSLSLILSTGCSNGGVQKQETQKQGGYMEQACTLPEGFGKIAAFQILQDGSLSLLTNADRSRDRDGPWMRYNSADQGESWSQKESPWLTEQGDSLRVDAAELKPDGEMRIFSAVIPDKFPEDPKDVVLTYHIYDLDQDGGLKKQDEFQLKGDSMLISCKTAENGDSILETYNGLYQLDAQSREIKYEYMTEPKPDNEELDYICLGDQLIVNRDNEILYYNLEQGQQTDRFETGEALQNFYSLGAMQARGKMRLLAGAEDRKALFFCDKSGIFSHIIEGTLVEEIMEGAATSFNLPTRMPYVMCVKQNTFYVLFEEGESYYLARYLYTEQERTEKTILKVYSLFGFRDGRLRQAIGQYELDHPDIQIQYTQGLTNTEGGGDYESRIPDVIRTLSTELLAGKGPDVILLDQLPVDSYIEKGVLLDLSSIAEEKIDSGSWIPQVVEGMRKQGGKLYGVPSSFTLPMMLGEPETVDSIKDYSGLVDWVVKQWETDQTIRPIEKTDMDYVWQIFYPMAKTTWIENPEQGQELLKQFLQATKKLLELDLPEEIDFHNSLDAAAWYAGQTKMAVGELSSMFDLALISSILGRGDKAGKLALLPSETTGYYRAKNILGINANSDKKDQAIEFLNTMLSPQIQKYEFYDGLPVNLEILKAQLQSSERVYTGGLVAEGLGSTRFIVDSNWPNPEMEQQFMGLLEQVSIPIADDSQNDGIFMEHIGPYLMGESSLEECVNSYLSVMKLQGEE